MQVEIDIWCGKICIFFITLSLIKRIHKALNFPGLFLKKWNILSCPTDLCMCPCIKLYFLNSKYYIIECKLKWTKYPTSTYYSWFYFRVPFCCLYILFKCFFLELAKICKNFISLSFNIEIMLQKWSSS